MLTNLPNVLLLYLAQKFLSSRDVVTLAASASFPHRVLHEGYQRYTNYWLKIDEKEKCMYVLDRYPTSKEFSFIHSRITTLPLRLIPSLTMLKSSSSAGLQEAFTRSEEKSDSASSRFVYTRSRYRIGLPRFVEIELVQPSDLDSDNGSENDDVMDDDSEKVDQQIVEADDAQEAGDNSPVQISSRTSWFSTRLTHLFSGIFSVLRCRRAQHRTFTLMEEEKEEAHEEDEAEEEEEEEQEDGEGGEDNDDAAEEEEPEHQAVRPNRDCYELDNLDFLPSTVLSLEIRSQLIPPPIAKLKHLYKLTRLDCYDTHSSHFMTPIDEWPQKLDDLTLFSLSRPNISDEERIEPEIHLPPSISIMTITMNHFTRSSTTQMLGAGKLEQSDPLSHNMQWPQSLKRLYLTDPDSSPLTRWQLPDSIEYLGFDSEYNGLITHLPSSLTQLNLHNGFNNSSLCDLSQDGWPQQLEMIRFGSEFDQDITSMRLPSSLTSLSLGSQFHHSLIDFQFPSRLKKFEFSMYWNRPNELAQISAYLPATLETLTFGFAFYQSLTGLILPPRLTELDLGSAANESLIEIGMTFPDSLTRLSLSEEYNQPGSDLVLPSHLRELYFGRQWNQPPQSLLLPSTLTILNLGGIDHSLTGMKWPSSLTDLTLGYAFSQPLSIGDLPSSLQNFTIRNRSYSHPLIDCILALPHLTQLWLASEYVHSSSILKLPHSIWYPFEDNWKRKLLKEEEEKENEDEEVKE